MGKSKEIWKVIEDFPNYEVSNLGRVRNNKFDRDLNRCPGHKGYLVVVLYKDGIKNTRLVHRLVADAFLGKHPTLQVNHIDGNKENNTVSNLEWCTCYENEKHAYENGLRTLPTRKKVKIIETGETFESIKQCAKAIDGDYRHVSDCLIGRRKSHRNLHFKQVENNSENNIVKQFLYDYQMEAVEKMFSGCILNGGVGTGKSRTGLYYYFSQNGGSFVDQEYTPMKNPKDLYIITTAMKRDNKEWIGELANYRMSTDSALNLYDNKIVIDSWNNIKKYTDITDSWFIFDEDFVTGNGAWVKHFLKIVKRNNWFILSATPGDSYEQYIPVFIANGFYRNKTEFIREHVEYSRYTKYPKIERYHNTGRLNRLRDKILIDMEVNRHTVPHHEDVYVKYDIKKYKDTIRTRWDCFRDEPIQQASGLCYVLRRIVNEDESRVVALLELLEKHPKAIVFYSFDYEREMLLHVLSEFTIDDEYFEVAEWSGHAHNPVPDGDKWVYLVNYNAGNAGWNCITTDTIIFYSQNYSYKVMAQASGRIDRINTRFIDLYYYHLKSRSGIDLAISKALSTKKKFNESRWVKW